MIPQETIVALATPSGAGAIAIIRLSGKDAIAIAAEVFQSVSVKDITKQKTHTIHLGHIVDNGKVYDQVLLSIFKGPNSYTGENVIEISCHGSTFIQQQIIQLLLRKGAKMAQAGEFTLRAFLNGKLDLSQAEAVADLIASDNEASHQIAMQQMRGGFSNEIAKLREELLNFASLIELELDFAEEDVEFADRSAFHELLNRIEFVLKRLIDSFAVGNVIKNGIPVAIVGEPNVGKSTLLNALLNEERAIVSDIAGTTRDTIEDELVINGIGFRFIDTAGIRETFDEIERIGISRSYEKMKHGFYKILIINPYELDVESLKNLSQVFFDLIVFSHADLDDFPSRIAQFDLSFLHAKNIIFTDLKTGSIGPKVESGSIGPDAKSGSIGPDAKSGSIGPEAKGGSIGPEAKSGSIGPEAKSGSIGPVVLDLIDLKFTEISANKPILLERHRYKINELNTFLNESLNEFNSLDDLAIASSEINRLGSNLSELIGQVSPDDVLNSVFSNFCIGK